ncbi:MAG: hypothetical protein LBG30_07875 [Odoribacteraceae bacterium]|jgi:hypothetical protein|nr:hypothetical protein [Odoribacteraceae bacterium]
MFKKIIWSLVALLLAALVAGALWWLHEREQEEKIPVETFIPDNSAIVLRVQDNVRLPAGDGTPFQHPRLRRAVDALTRAGVVDSATVTLAIRVEGKESIRFLYVLNRDGLFHRGDLPGALEQCFPGSAVDERDFGRNAIHSLVIEKETIRAAAVGSLVLLSDSRLYLEDALRRVDMERPYEQARHYFSSSAKINLYLGAACFAELLPLYLKNAADLRGFSWGALDGYLTTDGASFHGFLHPGETARAFPAALRGQRAVGARLDEVLPADVKAVSILRLSDTKKYLADLEAYRLAAKLRESVLKREQEYAKLFGSNARGEWQELFRGEIAKGVMEVSAGGEEEGVIVIHLTSGSKGDDLLRRMITHRAARAGMEASALQHLYRLERNEIVYYDMPATDFCSILWGDVFDGMPARYAFVQDNYLVLASSRLAVQRFVKDYFRHSSIRDAAWYKRVRERLGVNHNWMHVAATSPLLPLYRLRAKGAWADYLRAGEPGLSAWGYQWSGEEGMLYASLAASAGSAEKQTARLLWQTRLDADAASKPAIVKNHVTGEREVMVQDRANTLYLISDVGLILWKLPVQGAINSEIYQVDFYKNGKLQYLFSTPTHLYIVDRNGFHLPRYPLPLKSRCEVGVTLFDYENNRDYRVAAPGEDRHLYLFALDGNPVKGWETPTSSNAIASKMHHFRTGQRDYLVFLDRDRLYMLDRRGKTRTRVDHPFNVAPHTPLYLSRRAGKPVVLFADARREAWWVDFEGNAGSWKSKDAAPYHLNVGDVNADGIDEWIFASGETLSIHDQQGRLLREKRWEGATLGFPYIYRFSSRDVRVGLLDEARGQLLLAGSELSKGFPLAGATPFSVAFHGGDSDAAAGFNLFVGGQDGYLLKYRVQE